MENSQDYHSNSSYLNQSANAVEPSPDLLVQQQALLRVIAKIREFLDLDVIFNITASEVRQLLNADRVAVFRFYLSAGYNDGEFVSESVLPAYSSTLTAKVQDHCFGDRYAIHYQQGRVQAIADIHTAGLKDCHVQILSQFQVRANLVVPLLQGDILWGLLCIHQCAAPRHWQVVEIDLVKQVASHLSTALYQAELLSQVKYQAQQQKALFEVVNRIRGSLSLTTIFETTAQEVRQLLNADRVGVFRFHPDSNYDDGEFVSEAVLPQYNSALAAKIHDHCFGDQYAVSYRQGRIQAIADIYQAGLSDCHIEVLARFQIRANLIVPLLQGDRLWGLLCIHQCSSPRQWRSIEIDFVKQIAGQLGIALQQGELLEQTRQQANELASTVESLKKAQTQLIQTEKMSSLGQLVAGVAHEINNPVNFIYGNLKYVTEYTDNLLKVIQLYQQECQHPTAALQEAFTSIDLDFLQADFPKLLSSMQVGADRIRQIVLSLRNFSRLDEAEMKPVNIHEGLDSTLLILQHRLKSQNGAFGIKIIKDYGKLPPIECYASQLNQVFMNILSNAIDAFEESDQRLGELGEEDRELALPYCLLRQITIHTELVSAKNAPVPRAVIRITDNGAGIPASLQPRLFDPFFTTKPTGKGTGLGLSISHQIIVQRHGGALWCQSPPGGGSEFWIEIPVSQTHSRVKVLR
ncbi:MAG: GAF domain-containing sensor histidine kinase [Leptolyngbyaceae cyanobacterium SL_7_1]|nr:GAF domain-containing sensor histidine kinase [Leptolyngbyaceae cyanobacterium SL_7_1]